MKKRFNKTDRQILSVAIACLLMMLYLLYDDSLIMPSDQPNSPGIAQVVNISNDVRRKYSDSYVWRGANDQDTLHLGDSVFAGKGSNVVLQFNDGRQITVEENSLIIINSNKNQLELNLKFGKFKGQLPPNAKLIVQGKPVEIKDTQGPVQIASDAMTPSYLLWSQKPPTDFFHKNHDIPLVLTWESSRSNQEYRLQFSQNRNFEPLAHQETTTKKRIKTTKYPNQGKFYIRVQEFKKSERDQRETEILEINITDISAPLFISPQNQQILTFKTNDQGKFETPPTVPLEWTSAKKAEQFEVQISTSSDFDSLVWTATTPDLKTEVFNLKEGKYFARVRDIQTSNNGQPLWSEAISFEVAMQFPIQNAPQLLTKRINYHAPDEPVPVLKWTSVEEAHQYTLEVSPSPDFKDKQEFSTTETSFAYQDYVPGSSFFRVFAVSKSGFQSKASDTGKISVQIKQPLLDPVEPKVILGQSPEDPGAPQNFDLSWNDLKLPTSYVVEVSKESDFQQITPFSTSVPKATITVPEPGKYYVRVRGLNQMEQPLTPYSSPQMLDYRLKVPLSTPQLIEPLNQITLYFQNKTSPYVWLEWNPVRQALKYEIQVALDPDFNQKVLTRTATSRRYLIKENLPQGILYWRVRATGEADQISNWSVPRIMTVLTGKAPQDRHPAGRRR